MKKALKGARFCLTIDTWTSLQNLNYICLTAYFIDCDWKLHKKIINFCLVPNHKGETLGKVVEQCLVAWGIDKFLTITVDNATCNDGLIAFLKKRTKDKKTTILNHKFLHVRFCAYVLNLIIAEGLKDINQSIIRVRNIVKYVRSSPSRFAKFKSCAEIEGIVSTLVPCLDVATRWNSTYLMLNRGLYYAKAFERMEDEDGHKIRTSMREDVEVVDAEKENGVKMEREHMDKSKGSGKDILFPNVNGWEIVKLHVEILKLFYDATLHFLGSLYVTCYAFF